MTIQELNYSPLKKYASLFRLYVGLKRIRMILVRIVFAALVVYLVVIIIQKRDVGFSYNSSGSGFFNPLLLVVIWWGANFFLLGSMNSPWTEFADINGLGKAQEQAPDGKMRVPSFRGKLLTMSLQPLVGKIDTLPFGFFTRIYKEGGVIRWRERKMDTILWYDLPKAVPHIVVDSRFNERARRSNLSKHYDKDRLIHFEGGTGDKYNAYTAVGNEVAALQLFTPDVLEVLFDKLPQIDIETKGNTIWFVWRYGVLDDQLASDLFTHSLSFLNEFITQLNAASFTETQLSAEI